MASSMMLSLLGVMAVAFFVGLTTLTSAQNIPSCATKLIPCSDYLNSTTKPPSSCCNPVKEAVANELPCLCNLYKNPGLLSSFGVNVTQALQISQRCGVKADLSVCNKAATAPAPAGLQGTPPPAPGNEGSRMAWTGFTSLVLLLASFSFH